MSTALELTRFLNANGFSSPETIEWDQRELHSFAQSIKINQNVIDQFPEMTDVEKEVQFESLRNLGMFPFLATFRPDLYELIFDGSHSHEEYSYCLNHWRKNQEDFLPYLLEAASKVEV